MIIGTLESMLIILSAYIILLIVQKLVDFVKLIRLSTKEGSVIESLKDFTKEEYIFLCKKFLEKDCFIDFVNVYDDFFVCCKNGIKYGLIISKEEKMLKEKDIEHFYGYIILNNLDGMVIITSYGYEDKIKEKAENVMNLKFISYSIEQVGEIYNNFFEFID
ncbi:hypothetical protein SAMN02745163_00856 [Clostridium cavendishii DSM 21758]|uniref:Restriction endonuclease n=1 Tax=Clostridium cavendishii DSM 21758 TaxID=1121302 RepID=A0A1M6EHL8_9CLOT|nr:hypothetical protein [Clostridium cavendishii]SHI84965.1 hypothetical protein SAMN02745163_00856 [Clostridium cavendishii DSM 21758]